MTDDRTLQDLARRAEAATEPSELWELSLRFFEERGIARVSYHFNDPLAVADGERFIATSGFPEDWVRHYVENDLALIDPIPARAARVAKPFLWSEVGAQFKLIENERRFMRELEAAELGDGLAFQVVGPGMRTGYVGLGFGGGTPPDLSSALTFELKCAAQITHLRYCELQSERERPSSALSERERDVLEWIARGKSNAAIAEILGLSRHTIDTLTRRIFEKLGAADRTTAALRGFGRGVLSIGD